MNSNPTGNNPKDSEKRKRGQVGLYRAGITSPERLERTTIGREPILSDLLEKLDGSTKKKTHQHFVFVGPRGVGKTNLLSLLVNRIASSSALHSHFVVVRFAEETHRLLSFADFLLRICDILGNQPGHEDWRDLYGELAEQDDDQEIIDTLEPRLNSYRKQMGRLLLLLVENLDEILMRQIKDKQGIHQLRKFLMTTPSAILVATTPIVFPGLTDGRQPFYDFFDIQALDNLTQSETVEAIRANLAYDQRDDLLGRFNELSPKIKALHEMTGGNPRLIMMHYALIADEKVWEVKQQFEELLDRISPFYQDRIKDLPPQERAVLETMALIRTQPKTPALIARRLRKSPQQTSSLLKRLTQSGYLVVMDHPEDKRSKIYRIKEGFFDIWLSMNESRQQRKRLPALTEFFELWYERAEREEKRRELIDNLLAGGLPAEEERNHSATLDYLSDAGPEDEKMSSKVKLAALSMVKENLQAPDLYLEEVKALKPEGVMLWLTDHSELWAEGSRWPDPIKQIEDMISCWQLQRAGRLEQFSERLLKIGRTLQDRGLHEALADLLISSAEEVTRVESKVALLMQAAGSQDMIGNMNAALATLNKALKLTQADIDQQMKGSVHNRIGLVHEACGDYDSAFDHFQKSLTISQEIGDRAGEAAPLHNIGLIYKARGDYDTALGYYQRSQSISQEVGDHTGEGVLFNDIGRIYQDRGDGEMALKLFQKSLRLSREVGDRWNEGVTLNNIGRFHQNHGDQETALGLFQQSLIICQETGDRLGERSILNNIGLVYKARSDYKTALSYYQQSLDISKSIGSPEGMIPTLFNMAMAALQSQDMEKHIRWMTEAYTIAKEIGNAAGLFHVGRYMGQIMVRSGKKAEGLKILQQCLDIGKKTGLPGVEAIERLLAKFK